MATLRSHYLSVEVVVQVSLLVLCAQHVHDFAVLRSAGGTLGLALSVALKAVLVEGVAAEEVNRRQLQRTVAHVALGLLEYLGTAQRRAERGQKNLVRYRGKEAVSKREKKVEHTWF